MQLNVPFIKQAKKCDCWHAAAQMLYAYKRHSSVDPLSDLAKQADCGVGLSRWQSFLTAAKLRAILNPNVSYTPNMIQDMLCNYGPVIVVIKTGANSAHALLLTGADNENIYYNDPFFGPENLDWDMFNDEVDHAFTMAYLP